MRCGACAGLVCFLALGLAIIPAPGQGAEFDEPPAEQEAGVQLEQNYPKAYYPTTRIPFYLDETLFEDGSVVVVSVRIYNVLRQLVAIPTALDHAEESGTPVDGLAYRTPGRKVAYWDGLDQNGREVVAGVYYIELVVNGDSRVRRMFLAS